MQERLRQALIWFLKSKPSGGLRGQGLGFASVGTRDITELARSDLVWGVATGALAAVLFAMTLTSHPGLGDAPETVAGVTSLGVLHSPGYPAYVLVAKAFTLLVPFGNAAFRVNLFSLVCASLSITAVQLLARRCGAARWASSLAALTLATGVGFWFYAGFAKHDMFSGLMFLVVLHLLLAWLARPAARKLVATAALFAVGLGSSWPLMLLLLPTMAFVLFVRRRQLSVRSLGAATAAGLVLVVAVYGFVMIRASQNPPLNWGGATSISRLYELVSRGDFTPHINTAPSSGSRPAAAGATGRAPAGAAVITPATTRITSTIGNYAPIFGRELGILALILAAVGLLSSLRRGGAAAYVLLVTFVVNLVGAAAIAGPGGSGGVNSDLIQEGFILGCYFVLACWVAIGATILAQRAGEVAMSQRWNQGRLSRAAQLLGASVLAAVLLVPPVLSHGSSVRRDAKPFADGYATSVFSEVPQRSVLVIWTAEAAQPLIYRQVVYHQRRDVTVVAGSGLTYGWYREQVSRELGLPLPPVVSDSVVGARRFVKSLLRLRPVYFDAYTAQLLGGVIPAGSQQHVDPIGYRPVGIVAQATSASGPGAATDPRRLDQAVRTSEATAGMPDRNWFVWPNVYVATSVYLTAGLEVARAYANNHDSAGLHAALLNQLRIDPNDEVARADLQKFTQSHGSG